MVGGSAAPTSDSISFLVTPMGIEPMISWMSRPYVHRDEDARPQSAKAKNILPIIVTRARIELAFGG